MNFVALITNFIISYILIIILVKYSSKLGLQDLPNERSSHKEITPRGAGIGFGVSFFISFIFFKSNIVLNHWLLFLALLFVFIVGILDDHRDTKPRTKFYVIFASTILLYLDNIYIHSLGTYFGYSLPLLPLAIPFTIFAVAGFTNAINLIDGLDGLAGSISVIILSTLFVIGYENSDILIMYLSSFALASVLAFLILNWNPADIFMGDSGSLFLGFLISVVTIVSLKYIHPVAGIYILALPIMDTLIVMIRRIRKKQSPFSPDKTHIHHILLNFFQNKVKTTVLFLVTLQTMFSLVGLMLALNSEKIGQSIASLVALIAFIGSTALFYMIFSGMLRRQNQLKRFFKRRKKKKKHSLHSTNS